MTIFMDVDTALTEVPVNLVPLTDDTDFKTIETAVAYNAAGMALNWHFVTTAGVETTTAVTPTTAGTYDWAHAGQGMYTIEIPASGGASINNDTEGFGYFTGYATGVLPWRGPTICFRAAALNNALIDGGDVLDVSVTEFGGTAGTFASGRPEVNTTHIAGSAVSTSSAQLGVNVVQVSGDATAADNLELQYDGTGITGDTYPATQAQAGAIAVASSAINVTAESYTLTTGTQSSGTVSSTTALDGTTHQHTDTAGAMELYYQFDVGSDGIPVSVKLDGEVTGVNDNLGVYAYNWSGTSWDQVGTLVGKSAATSETNVYDLLVAHVGTGSNSGKVRIRFYAASGLTSATLYVDRILVSYAVAVGGIPNGTTITLTSSAANRNFLGHNWTLALGGQSIAGAYVFQSTNVSGTGTTTNGSSYTFQQCAFGTATLSAYGYIQLCAFSSTLTLTSTAGVSDDAVHLIDCVSAVSGSGSPTFDLSGVTKTTYFNLRRWAGGITVSMNSFVTTTLGGALGNGTLTLTNAGGNAEVRGVWKSVVLTTSGSAVTNIVMWSGCPITINGTGGTVNIYGVFGAVTDNSSGTTVNSYHVNNLALPASPTSGSLWERIKTMDDADLPTTAAAILADTGTDGVVLAANSVSAAAVAADAVAEIQNGLALEATAQSILTDTGTTIPATITTLQTTADALPTLAEILAGGDIDGYTLEETLKLCLAALSGKLSGAATTTITIRAADDSADRITATVDSDGNRSAVTLNAAG